MQTNQVRRRAANEHRALVMTRQHLAGEIYNMDILKGGNSLQYSVMICEFHYIISKEKLREKQSTLCPLNFLF